MFCIGENEGYVSSIIGFVDLDLPDGTITNYLENVKDDFGIVTEHGEIDMEEPNET